MTSDKIWIFIPAPLLGIFVGAFAAHQRGFSYYSFLPNVAGALLGGILFFTAYFFRARLHSFFRFGPWIAILLLIASLFSPGSFNVHRWISLGPIHLNVSMALTPLILLGIWNFLKEKSAAAIALVLFASLIFVVQPDRGQAMAFTLAVCYLLAFSNSIDLKLRMTGVFLAAVGAALTFYQIDPLPPVEAVEKILFLISGPFASGLAVIAISLLALLSPFLWLIIKNLGAPTVQLPMAFAIFLLAMFAVTGIGNYPVPVIGAGMAPVLGWYVMLAISTLAEPIPADAHR